MSNLQPSVFRIVAIRQPFALFESHAWRPQLNIYETEQGIRLIAEIAGVSMDDLYVHVRPASILIRGTRQIAIPPGLRGIQRMEIASGPFQVEVPLATPVAPDRVEAQYANGLLDVWLPFAPQATQRVVVIPLGQGGAR